MSGHVFHPGHQELHGITVVLDTHGSKTFVGRFDSQDERGVHLHDVGVYDSSMSSISREDFLRRCDKFGIRPEQRDLLVPATDIAALRRLVDAVGG
jgi:hypothetical protein